MKKIRRLLIAVLSVVLLAMICPNILPGITANTVEAARSLQLRNSYVTINMGKSKTIKIKSLPKGVKKKTVKWKTLNKYVAKVNKNGKVTAVGPGSTIIYAKVKGDLEICHINVPYSKAASDRIGKRIKISYKIKGNKITITTKNNNPFPVSAFAELHYKFEVSNMPGDGYELMDDSITYHIDKILFPRKSTVQTFVLPKNFKVRSSNKLKPGGNPYYNYSF